MVHTAQLGMFKLVVETQINATSPPSQTKLRFHNYDSLTRIVCILEALQKNICKANVLKNLQPAFTSMFAC